jgi:hypothetical protein
MNASFTPEEAAPVITPVKAPKLPVEPANVRAGFQRAIYEKPERPATAGRSKHAIQPARIQRVAMLDARIVRDIDRSARAEERRKRP